ncbi:MAG: EAL domain-containing protein, partial [Thermoanaerobaculia bacterium]
PALSSRAEARRDFESSLREAVSAGDLSLAYQPIFQIANGGVFGVEAFARWPSRERGPVPPAEFIAVAEETGIVVALGRPLRRFAFDFLKVDPSFIQVAREESRDAVIAKSVIRMGRLLGATVIAEGVETTEQLEFLRYHRCDAAQGWLFSPAVTAEAFERDFLPIAVR